MLTTLLLVSTLSMAGVSCDNDLGQSCLEKARLYRDGKGIPVDESSAMEFFEGACAAGNWLGCVEFGEWLLGLAKPLRDSGRAAQLFMDSCISGLGSACLNAGDLFILGDGVVRDAASAALWYELGCDFADLEACFRAGIGYEIGSGVSEDTTTAVRFFAMSCDGEFGPACGRLGDMHVRGTAGDKKDVGAAAELYRRSCEFGFGDGCFEHAQNLASMSKKERDYDEINRVIVAGCGYESPSCCLEAGELFESEDSERALKYYVSACEMGERTGCKKRDKLQKK